MRYRVTLITKTVDLFHITVIPWKSRVGVTDTVPSIALDVAQNG